MTALVFDGGVFLGADTDSGSEGEVLLSLTTTGAVELLGSTDHVAKGLAFGPTPQLPSLDDWGLAFLVIVLLTLGSASLGSRMRERLGRGRGGA